MDASHRGLLLSRLADAIERDSTYLAVRYDIVTRSWSICCMSLTDDTVAIGTGNP